jgi:hypothetical protein
MQLSPRLVLTAIVIGLVFIAAGNIFMTKLAQLSGPKSQDTAGVFFLGLISGIALAIVVTIIVSVGEHLPMVSKAVIALGALLLLVLLLLRYVS